MLLAECHSASGGWQKVDDLAALSELRADPNNLLWAEMDVARLTEEDVSLIAEEFDLHPLAVEDAINTRQRPKLEEYDKHLFVVFHQLDEVEHQLESKQLACFIGDTWVLTLHEGAQRTLEEAKSRWQETPEDHRVPSYLLHVMLDVVVDDYQRRTDEIEDETEQIEEVILEQPATSVQRQLYTLKQRLSRLRRYVLPMNRMLDWVEVEKHAEALVDRSSIELFRDVHDHLLRITDQIRNVDDLAQAILELTRGEQAQSLNEVSRKLTAWAAIFAVLTLIAGVYGMNFELVPEDGSIQGFWFALGLMAFVSVALWLYFKGKDWL